MLGIYANTFMTATGLNDRKIRPIEKTSRRWRPSRLWIDASKAF